MRPSLSERDKRDGKTPGDVSNEDSLPFSPTDLACEYGKMNLRL
jgi:hypothetical protein